MLEPVIEFVRPIPPLAFLPMFLVWFGLGEASKVAFIGYTTFFPMFIAVAASVLRVDVMLLRAAASLGASRADLIRRVILPMLQPALLTGRLLEMAAALDDALAAQDAPRTSALVARLREETAFAKQALPQIEAARQGTLDAPPQLPAAAKVA